MNTPGDANAELNRLLAALVDGELSLAEQQHLAALLHDDPALQKTYRDYLLVDALLRWETPEPPAPARPRPARRRWAWLTAGVVAAVALLAVALTPGPDGRRKVIAVPPEPTDDSVAVLIRAPGAEWDGAGTGPRPGALAPGKLKLKAGFAHLEFYSGATVVVEGPAEFELISRDRAVCTRGKLRATVPPHAQGFTIDTPATALVDRGTEFGLEVGGAGKTEVHVFQGKVDLYDPAADRNAAPKRALTTGQGVRLDAAGAADAIPTDPAAFLSARDLETRRTAEADRRRAEWLTASAAWAADPAMVLNYRFRADGALDRTLRDDAGGRREARDGTVVGGSWVSGRWPGTQALEFRRVSDRVRVYVPGDFDSVTLAAWVCFEGLPNRNNSLLMADGWSDGGMHWQVGSDGTAILGVQDRRLVQGAHYHAPGAVTPDRFGQWMHLAVVFDRAGRQVAHYVDGRMASQETIVSEVPLRLGTAELGNWNVATFRNNTPIRFLSGRMDEFMMFARALSEQEVERLHAQGRPPQ